MTKIEDLEFLERSAFEAACRHGNPRKLDEAAIIEHYKNDVTILVLKY